MLYVVPFGVDLRIAVVVIICDVRREFIMAIRTMARVILPRGVNQLWPYIVWRKYYCLWRGSEDVSHHKNTCCVRRDAAAIVRSMAQVLLPLDWFRE